MVRLLSMKKKLNCLKPAEDPQKGALKRLKQKRNHIIREGITKLKKIPDAEQCLHKAVLIRNTVIIAKELTPQVLKEQEDVLREIQERQRREEETKTAVENLCRINEEKSVNDETQPMFGVLEPVLEEEVTADS